MRTDVIDNLLSVMTLDEIRDALPLVDAYVRDGTLDAAEAEEWRGRIRARLAVLGERDVSG